MEYTIALIIHVLCAIIFLGFVFTDVVVLTAVKKTMGKEMHEKVMNAIIKRGIKIFPPIVLLLIATGGFMFTKYINSQAGMFNTSLQQLLMLKVFLVLLIILGVIYSLYTKFTNTKPVAFMEHFHTYTLIAGFFIVVLAKYMFVA